MDTNGHELALDRGLEAGSMSPALLALNPAKAHAPLAVGERQRRSFVANILDYAFRRV